MKPEIAGAELINHQINLGSEYNEIVILLPAEDTKKWIALAHATTIEFNSDLSGLTLTEVVILSHNNHDAMEAALFHGIPFIGNSQLIWMDVVARRLSRDEGEFWAASLVGSSKGDMSTAHSRIRNKAMDIKGAGTAVGARHFVNLGIQGQKPEDRWQIGNSIGLSDLNPVIGPIRGGIGREESLAVVFHSEMFYPLDEGDLAQPPAYRQQYEHQTLSSVIAVFSPIEIKVDSILRENIKSGAFILPDGDLETSRNAMLLQLGPRDTGGEIRLSWLWNRAAGG